jgi:predicted PurR-regulated permease PerM
LARSSTNSAVAYLLVLVTTVVAIATLYFAKVVLVPFALALLITFILVPLVRTLVRIRIPRILAVLLIVVMVVSAVGSIGWVVAYQLVDVTSQLPKYSTHIRSKIDSFRRSSPETLNKATAAVQQISTEIAASAESGPGTKSPSSKLPGSSSASAAKPVPVEVIPPSSNWLERLQAYLGPIGTAGIVVVFTVFMLFQWEELRDRFIRLAGSGRLSAMTRAMDEAGDRVSHYLLLQSLVNASYGLLAGLVIYFIGVPNALLWGVVAGLLRFLPYLGPPIGALLPVLFSLAVFDDWNRPLMVLGFFVVFEIIVANFIEPMLYGARTGISSLAVLVAAVFWTFLWGPIGLVLSTPLTVCLVVMGRHVPNMQFLNVLLGDDPVLQPEAHFYLRLLAGDHDGASQFLKLNSKGKSLDELYDSVLIPALSLAEKDRHRSDLDEASEKIVFQATREFVSDFGARPDFGNPVKDEETSRPPARRATILCIPARDEADEIIAIMLTQVLERAGHDAQFVRLKDKDEALARVEEANPDVVCISALPPFAIRHARDLYARLRSQSPGRNIVIGLWIFSGNLTMAAARIDAAEHIALFTTLKQLTREVDAIAEKQAGSNPRKTQEPSDVGVSD